MGYLLSSKYPGDQAVSEIIKKGSFMITSVVDHAAPSDPIFRTIDVYATYQYLDDYTKGLDASNIDLRMLKNTSALRGFEPSYAPFLFWILPCNEEDPSQNYSTCLSRPFINGNFLQNG